jgi:hypothetical protein
LVSAASVIADNTAGQLNVCLNFIACSGPRD